MPPARRSAARASSRENGAARSSKAARGKTGLRSARCRARQSKCSPQGEAAGRLVCTVRCCDRVAASGRSKSQGAVMPDRMRVRKRDCVSKRERVRRGCSKRSARKSLMQSLSVIFRRTPGGRLVNLEIEAMLFGE